MSGYACLRIRTPSNIPNKLFSHNVKAGRKFFSELLLTSLFTVKNTQYDENSRLTWHQGFDVILFSAPQVYAEDVNLKFNLVLR